MKNSITSLILDKVHKRVTFDRRQCWKKIEGGDMSTNDSNMFRSQVVWYLSQIIQDPPLVLTKGWLKILRSKNSKETQA